MSKFRRYILYALTGIMGVLLVVFLFLNLPFTRRYATTKVNQVLSSNELPVHLDRILKILPNSLGLQGVCILEPAGDTILYAGELQVRVRLFPLLRHKIMIGEVELDAVLVELARDYPAEEMNIAEAFKAGKESEPPSGESTPPRWEISLRRGKLSNIRFGMSDSVGGMHVRERVSEIALADIHVSLSRREIGIGSLFVGNASGTLHLTGSSKPPEARKGPPWNLSVQKIGLEELDFGFDNAVDSMRIETSIGKAQLRAEYLDLPSRTARLRKIALDDCRLLIRGGVPNGSKTSSIQTGTPFPWKIMTESLEVRNTVFNTGTSSLGEISEIDLQIGDLRIAEDEAGFQLRSAAFQLNNGFSLKSMRGSLESAEGLTRLQLDIRTGHSEIGIKASADQAYGTILKAPGQMARASLELSESRISLLDLRGFGTGMEEWALYDLLSATPMDVAGSFHLENDSLDLSGISLSQQDHFSISLEGLVQKVFHLQDATGDMDLRFFDLQEDFIRGLAGATGVSRALPELTGLKLEANISDSLRSPDFSLNLNSPVGSISADGSVDLQKKFFTLACSFRELALNELSGLPELGSFTGTGEIRGREFTGDKLMAGFYLQVDSLGFKGHRYRNVQLTGSLEPGSYGFQMVSRDQAFQGDVQVDLSLADSSLGIQTSGILQAQLNEMHLYPDTLGIKTSIEGDLIRRGEVLESSLQLRDMSLISPRKTAKVEEVKTFLKSDSIRSVFAADADFLHVDLQMLRPLDELDSLGRGYGDYFSSFRNASHIAADNRLSLLPGMDAELSVIYHELFELLVGDTTFHFATLEASIGKDTDQNSLHASIGGTDLLFKMLESDKFSATVADTAGSIQLELIADSLSLFSGPGQRLKVFTNTSDREMHARLNVDNYKDLELYQVGLAGRIDSSRIYLEIPDQRVTLNGEEWRLEGPELLSIRLGDNLLLPALQMSHDSSFVRLNAFDEAPFVHYVLDLEQVDLTTLVRNELVKGTPDGSFSGSLEYRTDRNTEKQFETELFISEISYSGQDYGDAWILGSYSGGGPDDYLIDIHARTDSLDVQINGKKEQNGERDIKGEFTQFPMVLMEPFTEAYLSDLGGSLSGDFHMVSKGGREDFTGQLQFRDARVKVNVLNSVFTIPYQGIELRDQKAVFKNFTILDTMKRALKLDGFIQFGNQPAPLADLNISSSGLQVMSRAPRSRAVFGGNIFIDSRIFIKGPLTRPDIGGSIRLSQGTEIFYHHTEDLGTAEAEKIVNFVSQAPPGGEAEIPVPLSGGGSLGSSSVGTVIEIDPNTRIQFTLARRMFDIDLNVKGGGNIQYNLANEQMALSGRYEIREGSALMKLVGWPDKSFRLTQGGFIRWDGLVDNPELNLAAENKVSTSYLNPIDGRNRDIDFFVNLRLRGYLSDLNIEFSLRTPDQYVMSVINTLSPEEEMRQAISVLLFESIDLPGISSSTAYMTQQVNQILSSQLNQMTRSAIKGVDISFGLDTYDQSSMDGSSETTTSLSYEVRKSFMNNRAQIEFSGRLRDANQASAASDHSLNNLTFEYALDSAANTYLKVFNEHSFDDVFEGEVVKTGIGFSYKKRYRTLGDIWRRKE